jgi:hypothetical protein
MPETPPTGTEADFLPANFRMAYCSSNPEKERSTGLLKLGDESGSHTWGIHFDGAAELNSQGNRLCIDTGGLSSR